MMMLKDMKMKPKLTILFVAAGILPLLVVGWWNARITSKALMQSSYAQLKNVREIKKNTN